MDRCKDKCSGSCARSRWRQGGGGAGGADIKAAKRKTKTDCLIDAQYRARLSKVIAECILSAFRGLIRRCVNGGERVCR